MRISAAAIANGAAWVMLALLAAVAVVMADVLGFLGLLIIGAVVWLVCARAAQDDNPAWSKGLQPFQSRANQEPTRQLQAGQTGTPEQRAARHAGWQASLEPLRFFTRCGMVLTVVGAVGFAWQAWWGAGWNGH